MQGLNMEANWHISLIYQSRILYFSLQQYKYDSNAQKDLNMVIIVPAGAYCWSIISRPSEEYM